MTEVFFESRKWPDAPHWRMHLDVLGRDEYGTWLGRKPPVAVDGPQGPMAFTHTFVLCVPENDWWVYLKTARRERSRSTSTSRAGGMGQFESCDYRRPRSRRHPPADGTGFLDERRVHEHQIALVTRRTSSRRLSKVEVVMEAVADRREPFGDAGQRYLDCCLMFEQLVSSTLRAGPGRRRD